MKVGFIGLGNVGGKLAESLLRKGYNISVFDLNENLVEAFEEKGAKGCSGPAEIMKSCNAIITCLPSPAASDLVMGEMLAHVSEGKIWMEMSTTDVAEVKRLGKKVISAGGLAVDCPVSGGCHRASTGNISIFAGCDRKTFEKIPKPEKNFKKAKTT